MMFLYDLPTWLLGVLVISILTALSVIGFFIYQKIFPKGSSENMQGLVIQLSSLIATINSLLLAFSAVSVWNAYDAAEKTVVDEANTAAQLARDLAVYNSNESVQTRKLLAVYLHSVVDDEWKTMSRGESNPKTWELFEVMFHSVGKIQAKTETQNVVLHEIWARVNELTKHRRERLHIAKSSVPMILWAVAVLGTVLTFIFLYILPKGKYSYSVIAMTGASFGLVFFFIVAMDRPFAGEECIEKDPFESTMTNMERWDKAFGAQDALSRPK